MNTVFSLMNLIGIVQVAKAGVGGSSCPYWIFLCRQRPLVHASPPGCLSPCQIMAVAPTTNLGLANRATPF